MSSPLREQIIKTTNLFLEAFNEFTPESVVRYRSPDCRQRLLPATMKSPPQTNAEYAALVGTLQPIVAEFKMRIAEGEEPIVDEVSRKVSMHLKSYSETTVGLYENEYVVILTLSEDGKSIVDIIEFVDSSYTIEWMPRFTAAAQEAAKKKS
ncbi:hypothetical protein F4804DRAFT_323142 [Jackrogersella minutella]|nr:hypothetical protein F4804DRAFT_323142 [Jackrogersella minutella]